MKIDELSCNTLLRPHSVQRCEMAACPAPMTWHVGDWGLVRLQGCLLEVGADFLSEITPRVVLQCSRSCGSGSRNREVICSDRERNLYPMRECSSHPMPSTVERCNTQPCHRPQSEHEWVHLLWHFSYLITLSACSLCSGPQHPGPTRTWQDPDHFPTLRTRTCYRYSRLGVPPCVWSLKWRKSIFTLSISRDKSSGLTSYLCGSLITPPPPVSWYNSCHSVPISPTLPLQPLSKH